jgi:hypothetical protein
LSFNPSDSAPKQQIGQPIRPNLLMNDTEKFHPLAL